MSTSGAPGPDGPLNAESVAAINDMDAVLGIKVINTICSDDRVNSILVHYDSVGDQPEYWQGRHYVVATGEWIDTFAGTDGETVRKDHKKYVAPDLRETDEYRIKNPDRSNGVLQDAITKELPIGGLNDADFYTLKNWDIIADAKAYLEDGETGNCISFVAKLTVDDREDVWHGYHYIEELQMWVKTFRSTDFEFVKDAHERYAIKEAKGIDKFVLGYTDMGKPTDDIEIPEQEPEFDEGTGLADVEGIDTPSGADDVDAEPDN